MSRKKRSKQRVEVGPKMRAVAHRQTDTVQAQFAANSPSSEKAALFEELVKSMASTGVFTEQEDSRSPAVDEPAAVSETTELIKLLADVATGLWRLRSKMLWPQAKQPVEEHRRSYKQLESILDILTQAGVQIRDHTGEAVPRGGIYTLKVLAYDRTAGLTREQVIETLKPTIVFNNQVVQTGEVIIGTPLVMDSEA